MNFFRKIIGIFSPTKLLSKIKNCGLSIKNYITSFISHFDIIREANISLGKFHLQNGNFKDATIRFWITNKLFAPNDPENLYWGGWADILQKKYGSAAEKLKDNSHDQIGLYNYITGFESAKIIPEKIYEEYESLSKAFAIKKFYNDKINLFDIFVEKLSAYLPKSNWDNTKGKYTLLEIASYPFMIEEISKHLPEPNLIDTVNFSQEPTKNAKNYNEKVKIYHEIMIESKSNFLAELSKKYDTIISFGSLAYQHDLKNNFKTIKNLLADDGIFAFIIPKGNKTELVPSENYYTYNENYVRENLKLADFELVSINTIVISKDYEFFVIVTK